MEEYSKNNDDSTLVLCFYYMQNLPIPNIPVQDIFYLRQLWIYVFCVHNVKTNKAVMYKYHEGQAKKSPDEVCSLLNDFLTNEITSSNIKNLVLFSDSCGGQNRNHTICCYLCNLTDRKIFDKIIHYYSTRGHSFLPCDWDFGLVKRCVRKVDRIHTPEQYSELILKSNTTNKFTCKVVHASDILDFKNWWTGHYKKSCFSVESSGNGIPMDRSVFFKISTYKEFVYDIQSPGVVIVKKFIDNDTTRHTFKLKKWLGQPPLLPHTFSYPSGKVPINLRKLQPYLVGYESFYKDILEWPICQGETGDD